MKTAISALIALVIGAGGTYFYQQGSVKQLQTAATALETQLSEAKTAADAASGEVTKLQEATKALESQLAEARAQVEGGVAEVTKLQESGKALQAELADAKTKAEGAAAEMSKALEEKTQELTALQAKVGELEAALAAAKAGSGVAP